MIHSIWLRLNALMDRWIPPFGDQRGAEQQLVHRYYQFLCTVIVIAFSVFGMSAMAQGYFRIGATQFMVIGATFLSAKVYRKTRSVTPAVNVILALYTPLVFYRAWITGGLDSPMFVVWPIVSALAAMTLPIGWTLFWTATHLGIAGYYYAAFKNGVLFVPAAPDSFISNIRIALLIACQIILYSSITFIRRLNHGHRLTMRAQSERITDFVRALSHDLSSPLMTLQHWVQSARKKGLGDPDRLDAIRVEIKALGDKISEVRTHEAQESGKLASVHGIEEKDPEVQLASLIFRVMMTALAAIFSAFAFNYYWEGIYFVAGLQALVAVVGLASLLVYQKTKSLAIAGSFVMFFGSISAFFRTGYLGGITSPAIMVWPIIPVFTRMLGTPALARFWTGVYIAIALYYDICHRVGIQFRSTITPQSAADIKIVALFLVQLLVIAAIYYLQKQNSRFRILLEEQASKKAALFRTLTGDIGTPLERIQRELSQIPASRELDNATKAAQACLEIIKSVSHVMDAQNTSEPSLQAGHVDLRDIVREVAFLQHNAVQKKGLHWQEDLPPGAAPLWVYGDRAGLAYQVLNNLVSNAIKFTDEGGNIALRIMDRGSGWMIQVEDSGIGIPETLLPKLFDPHKQTTRLGTQGEKGTGFGMPIVKRFIEQYGGTIGIESRTLAQSPEEHGTRVRIELPKLLEAQAA